MSVLQPTVAPSSTPVIQGEHAWISIAEMMANSLPAKIQQVEISAQKELNKKLKTELSTDQQWAPLIKDISLTVGDGTVTISASSYAVSDLEYGTPEIPLNSKLRPFLRTANEYLKDEIEKVLSEYS